MAIDKDGYIHIKWHIDDIKAAAEQMGIASRMTDEDAREILEIVKYRHDASVGINWDVIEVHIDNHMILRKEEQCDASTSSLRGF